MKQIAVAYLTTFVAFVAIDFVWLSFMGERLYRPVLKDLLAPEFRIAPAVVFYLAYAAGLVWFVVLPALGSDGWRPALVNGALLGLFAYATYDLTNQATLREWSTLLTVADMCWGAVASAAACLVATGATAALVGRT